MNRHHFNQLSFIFYKNDSMQFKKKNPGWHNNPPPSPVDCIKLPLNLKGKKWSTNAQIHLQVTNSDNHAEYKRGLQLDWIIKTKLTVSKLPTQHGQMHIWTGRQVLSNWFNWSGSNSSCWKSRIIQEVVGSDQQKLKWVCSI